MQCFTKELRKRAGKVGRRRWLYVPYDQLSEKLGPLAREPKNELGVVLVESPWKAAQRPYHRQKLALVLANQRHFALELAEHGVAVRYVVHDGPYREALAPLAKELGTLRCMEPAERELRVDLAPLVKKGALEFLPHEGWLTTREQFIAGAGESAPWRMDAFYREVRRTSGILMEKGKPVGGKWSFDAENRRAWKGEPPAPTPPRFEPDAITREVGELVETRFAKHPGELRLDVLPVTKDDAETLWKWARTECLPHFGPFEDAMSTRSSGLFHTRIAPLVNLHRLLPRDVVDGALRARIDLASQEGFVRQVLGWREFVRHVHRETDGFRTLAPDARPSVLDAHQPLPAAFWGEKRSGLACLDSVVADVWREGWTHHIPRLMVLANLATLFDLEPREVADWFWVAYTDAYDWVVEPNVLAMGMYAVGGMMTTKPYISGAAYIERMSDYCKGCRFDPKSTCPITPLYWAFLARHGAQLTASARMDMPLRSAAKRTPAQRARDRSVFEQTLSALLDGREVPPAQGAAKS
jgi:deoxyribodipyrimidine photolyase-related protein